MSGLGARGPEVPPGGMQVLQGLLLGVLRLLRRLRLLQLLHTFILLCLLLLSLPPHSLSFFLLLLVLDVKRRDRRACEQENEPPVRMPC